MTSFDLKPLRRRRALQFMAAMGAAAALPPTLSAGKPGIQRQLWITNAYGNDVHVYEVGTWKLVRHLVVGLRPHGISATADGRTVHISLEVPKGELLWIDTRTGKITDRIVLDGRPNAHESTPDGKWIYVPNRSGGYWWVVDGEKKQVVKTIRTDGSPHNTRISANAKRMYLSPQGPTHEATIVDIAAGHTVIGKLLFSESLRPSAISSDEQRFFQNVDGLIGFEVVDIPSHRLVGRISHGIVSEFPKDPDHRSHGLEVRPDQQEVWSSYLKSGMLYVHDMTKENYPELARIQMPGHVYWIRFNPDSQYGYVSLTNIGKVAVVNTKTRKITALLATGYYPKRTCVIDVPVE